MAQNTPAVFGPVESSVRPRAWLVEDPDPNGPRTFIATQDMEDAYSLATDEAPPIALYDGDAIAQAARITIRDYQASGDTDLDELVQRSLRDMCRLLGVDLRPNG